MDEDQQPQAHEPDARSGDALDRAVRPAPRPVRRPRCWPSSSAARVGTVARYLLDAHHPVAQGHFPWVTLVINLSGSLAIGLLVPLTEHVDATGPLGAPAPRRRLPGGMDHLLHAGRRGHVAGQGRRHRHLRGLSRRDGDRRAGARRGRQRARPEDGAGMSSSSPTLGLALVVALAGGAGAVLRALLIHHVGVRRADPLPLGHHAGQRVGVAAPRHPDRALPLPRARIPPARRHRRRALRRLHDLVHRQLGDDPPAAHRPPHGGRHLHAWVARRLPRLPPPPARAHGARVCTRVTSSKASGGGQLQTRLRSP